MQLANHEYDEEAVCVYCGFDGAEWHWWRYSTYEGRAADAEQQRVPACRDWQTGLPRVHKP